VPVPATVLKLSRDRIEARPADKAGVPRVARLYAFARTAASIRPGCNQVGVPGLVPHELRHTCASLAIRSAGASIKAVQALLGQKTATMTLDRYGSLYDSDLDAVALRLDAECVYRAA
jgi:integrase